MIAWSKITTATVLAFFAVSIAFSGKVDAEQSVIHVLSGDYQVSGGDVGCARIEGTKYIIAFGATFDRIPRVDIQTTVFDANDTLDASITDTGVDYVEVTATGTGRNGPELCAKALIHWTANR
jgi:hypothetical protein